MKTKKLPELSDWISSVLTIVFAVLITMFNLHQYKDDPVTAAVSSGCACFLFGILFFFFLSRTRREKIFRIRSQARRSFNDIQRYMDHPSDEETINHAFRYYGSAIKIVQEEEAQIIVRWKDGHEQKFDPVTLEVFPEDEEGEDWKF